MSGVLLGTPVRWWKCPSCDVVDRTERNDVHTQFHPCRALNGANIPLIEVGSPDDKPNGRQVVVAREDYVGANSPVASIRTERGDGSNDCTVFAPMATVSGTSPQKQT
jgi:hypothetical protein